MKDLLSESEIAERMPTVPDWVRRGAALERTFERGDFDGSLAFVNQVAKSANAANHHPDITICWNLVTLSLSSHDSGGITERDFTLARTIDAL